MLKKLALKAKQKLETIVSTEWRSLNSEWKSVLLIRAMNRSCEFIEHNSTHLTNLFDNHWDMRADALDRILPNGLLLEFGVNRGQSANFFCNMLEKANDPRPYYGFDTFTGLTEDWGGVARAGTFNRDGKPPELHPQVDLVIGDILNTLGPFLEIHQEPVSFIHIDTDTYSPCSHVLKLTKKRLINGSVILFDELIGYPNFESHELKALEEELPKSSYRFLSFGVSQPRANFIKAAIEIVDNSLLI
jgi:hypothetical protein